MRALTADEPYVALVTGLGGGKTYAGARWIVGRAIQYPEGVHLVTINSYPQSRDIVIPEIERACQDFEIDYEHKVADSEFRFAQGGCVLVRSTVKYNGLRGLEVDSWWADEVRDAPAQGIKVLWGRMRGQKADRPRALWTTTPNGFDHIYERFVEKPVPGRHLLVHAPTTANPDLPEDYVPSLLEEYGEREAAQEIQGQFLAIHERAAYYAFEPTANVRKCTLDMERPIGVTFDFNVDPFVCEIVQENGMETHVCREIVQRSGDIYGMADKVFGVLRRATGEVTIYGDPSGHQRSHQTGRTSYAMLTERLDAIGLRHRRDVPSSAPGVRDRVNAMNARLRSATGVARLFIDPSCTLLIKDLKRVAWDTGGNLDKKEDPDLTHASDAVGYYVHRRHRPSGFRRDHDAIERMMP